MLLTPGEILDLSVPDHGRMVAGGGVTVSCTQGALHRGAFLLPFPSETWRGLLEGDGGQESLL